jgi:hypothetical protein
MFKGGNRRTLEALRGGAAGRQVAQRAREREREATGAVAVLPGFCQRNKPNYIRKKSPFGPFLALKKARLSVYGIIVTIKRFKASANPPHPLKS